MTMSMVLCIARADFVCRTKQPDVVAARKQLVQRNVQVHVHLVDREIKAPGERAIDYGRFGQRIAHENRAMTRGKTSADEIRRRRSGGVFAIDKARGLLDERILRSLMQA